MSFGTSNSGGLIFAAAAVTRLAVADTIKLSVLVTVTQNINAVLEVHRVSP
jgi:hypothetical protein